MLRYTRCIGNLVIYCLLLLVVFSITLLSSAAEININEKVALLDMNDATPDDVIRIFGEPEKYLWGRETFTKDNLPSRYLASYDSDRFYIYIEADKINEIRFEGGDIGYLYKGKIRVDSSLDDVLAVVGEPERTVVGQSIDWDEGVLSKDINGTKGYCYYKPAGQNVRFFFGNYKVSGLYLTTPESVGSDVEPITLVERFDDVRWKDMSKLDLSVRKGLIATLDFNLETVWPIPKGLPKGPHPKIVLSRAMNPGLGIKGLHREGITGKGVNVAIIDQPTYLDHSEFSGNIVRYYDTGCGSKSSIHGPAVISLLVGNKCGTAPGAKVYYVAVPSWKNDAEYDAKGLDWIIEQNRNLPASEKIRVVSVSASPSSRDKNPQMWDEACSRAEAEGILVLDCTSHRGIVSPCWYDANDPEDVSKCTPGFPGIPWQEFQSERIFVPASPRTTAEEYDKGEFGYQYNGRGGLSWTIPYCAGVLAMGWQVNPQLSSEQMRELLFQSAYINESGAKIINPVEFIKLVRKTKPARQQM
jgi:hypothetical protein